MIRFLSGWLLCIWLLLLDIKCSIYRIFCNANPKSVYSIRLTNYLLQIDFFSRFVCLSKKLWLFLKLKIFIGNSFTWVFSKTQNECSNLYKFLWKYSINSIYMNESISSKHKFHLIVIDRSIRFNRCNFFMNKISEEIFLQVQMNKLTSFHWVHKIYENSKFKIGN